MFTTDWAIFVKFALFSEPNNGYNVFCMVVKAFVTMVEVIALTREDVVEYRHVSNSFVNVSKVFDIGKHSFRVRNRISFEEMT